MSVKRATFKAGTTGGESNDGERLPNIRDLVNTDFGVSGVRYGENQYGDFAIVDIEDGGSHFVGQSILVKQLRNEVEPVLKTADVVDVRLVKVKDRYYSFVKPE